MIESIGFPVITTGLFAIMAIGMFCADVYSHRSAGEISIKSAVKWSVCYVFVAMLFALHLYMSYGAQTSSLFLTGYTLEKVLAFDNLFVFSLIFSYFNISKKDKHAALHWGIMGAVVFRFIFVFIGVGSMALFGPVMEMVFALLIAYTIYLIIMSGGNSEDYNSVWYVRKIKQWFPSVTTFVIAVCVIEVSDVMFAFDSVPAIISITKDPLIIYSSMIFAILGLRSMYFVIDSLKDYLIYMDATIICVLGFISVKLAFHAVLGISLSPGTSLAIILSMLFIGVSLSLIKGVNYEAKN